MKRLRGSLIAYPFDSEIQEDCELLFGMSEKFCNEVYSKLVLAKTNDIVSIIQREYKELKNYLGTDLDDLERSFAEKALQLLSKREELILEKLEHMKIKSSGSKRNEQAENRRDNISKNLENNMKELPLNEALDEKIKSGSNLPSKFHYFYQGE